MASNDPVGAGERWIPQQEYDLILARVPIVCVDLIPLSADQPPKVGLIERATYDGGRGWCLVGGAVLRNESLPDAVGRHVGATLGDGINVDPKSLTLVDVVQYFTEPDLGDFFDPRKHAVSLTFAGRCRGQARVTDSGEASRFSWFRPAELDDLEFGFNQGAIVKHFLSERDSPANLL